MSPRQLFFTALATALLLAVNGANAESVATSASSTASSAAGSASDSLGRSSDSSSPRRVADGRWQIEAITARAERPGTVTLTLRPTQAAQGDEPLALTLPQTTADAAGLQVGQQVASRAQAWGWQFARADAAEPFYLVLADATQRTLQAQPVL